MNQYQKKRITPEQVEFDNQIIKHELCPTLWIASEELKENVHQRLLEIGMRFSKFIGVEIPIDILLTGSLCNFNYNESSDIDIHVMVDFAQYGDPELIKSMYQAKKYAFNDYRKGTTIKGFPIECYAQDIPSREPHHPSGLYSILHRRWLIKPERINPQIDESKLRELLSIFINAINRLSCIEDNQKRLEHAIELKNNLVLIRRMSVQSEGEYSPGNLCFKILRRQGYVSVLFDTIRKSMDIKLSLEHFEANQKILISEQNNSLSLIRSIIREELQRFLDGNTKED